MKIVGLVFCRSLAFTTDRIIDQSHVHLVAECFAQLLMPEVNCKTVSASFFCLDANTLKVDLLFLDDSFIFLRISFFHVTHHMSDSASYGSKRVTGYGYGFWG